MPSCQGKREGSVSPSAHQVVCAGVGVRGGGKASQSFIVHKNPERVTGGHQHVDPQVKLEPVNDEGLGERREDTQASGGDSHR